MKKSASSKEVAAAAPFVNRGLERWKQRREQWLSSSRDVNAHTQSNSETDMKLAQVMSSDRKRESPSLRGPRGEVIAKNIDVEDVIERIFSASGSGELSEPLPLGQLIDILIDFWEADGLYD